MRILVVTSHRPWELTEPLETTDATVSTIQIDPSRSRTQRLRDAYCELTDRFERFEPDVVLLDLYELPGVLTARLAARHDVPLVMRLVGDRTGDLIADRLESAWNAGNYGRYVSWQVSKRLSEEILETATGAIVVSSDLRDRYVDRGVFEDESVAVVPVPFRPEAFDPTANSPATGSGRAESPLPPDVECDELVLTVTNLSFERKFRGVYTALDELEGVLEARPNAHYVVAGGGQYEQALRTTVECAVSADVRERVTVAGFVDDVASLYAAADVFVYVSHLDGYPNAVLEAQGMGLPVVANDAVGMVDQIDHDETGVVADPTESGAIATAVRELLTDDDRRSRIGQAARTRVTEDNSMSSVGAKLLTAVGSVS
ncbi:glycosyltransferase family 4 protein [Natrarchaeobaculum aegyptiacum]|uniref:Glycosyl transferase family 1 domain-containing protein n=1 Tax=Natrarchaeobaculum aegyptiacum TaxID=745377 RepID=A0A2Z2HY60_9EURY|nr:glycosyltransferase family 4 protein [Natrarchaeobaculum aegyptiacum]ARS89974.1 hypothetical protein B1756_09690 [Natrarchaeobaculum aegyptiacum]